MTMPIYAEGMERTLPTPQQGPEFDWNGLEEFLVEEITTAVALIQRANPHARLQMAAVTDFYAQRMLILWPRISIAAHSGRTAAERIRNPHDWEWHPEPIGTGDDWAGRLTAHAGNDTQQWEATIEQFFDTIVSACRSAAEHLRSAHTVDPEFFVAPIDETDHRLELVQRSLTSRQLQRCLPEVHARRVEIERLWVMPIQQQVDTLLSAVIDNRFSAIDINTAQSMLIWIGDPAAESTVKFLRSSPNGLDTEVERRLFTIIDLVSNTRPEITDRLLEILRDREVSLSVRAAAASSLAWLGQLEAIISDLDELPRDLTAAVIARPYFSARKNGPLSYRALEAGLQRFPALNSTLSTQLSPTAMFEIDRSDIPTAIEALTSDWSLVRSHAANVLLTAHI